MALELVRSVWDGFWGPKWGGLGVVCRFTMFCVLCAKRRRSAHTGKAVLLGRFGQAAVLLTATVPPLSSERGRSGSGCVERVGEEENLSCFAPLWKGPWHGGRVMSPVVPPLHFLLQAPMGRVGVTAVR